MRPSRLLWCALVYVAESYRYIVHHVHVMYSFQPLLYFIKSAKT